jgi:hypothetical protein
MGTVREFNKLGNDQLLANDALDLLVQTQLEFNRARAGADFWALVAILSNAVLIPMNAIINTFKLKGAKTLYRRLVLALYSEFAQSGSRTSGTTASALSMLKNAVVEEMRLQRMEDYIPVVNILIGVAEDSLALWQTIKLIEADSGGNSARAARLENEIAAWKEEIRRIGIRKAEILNQLQNLEHTA